METKDRLLSLLEENRDRFVSGGETAEALSVSRTAVWKAAEALRKDGYEIEAVPRRGYRLKAGSDVLSENGVKQRVDPAYARANIRVEQTVTSTNRILRDEAAGGAPEGTVLIAACQTEGRGRVGRKFFSPPDTIPLLSGIRMRPFMCLNWTCRMCWPIRKAGSVLQRMREA